MALPQSHIISQTIPPIVVSGPNAIAGCTVLNLTPGSAIANTTGVIQASCPDSTPAITLRTTETPTFVTSVGWVSLGIEYASYSCTSGPILITNIFGVPHFGRLIGMNLTSGSPITMTDSSNSTTQLLSGGYDYCLFYNNPPATGMQSFTVTWTP